MSICTSDVPVLSPLIEHGDKFPLDRVPRQATGETASSLAQRKTQCCLETRHISYSQQKAERPEFEQIFRYIQTSTRVNHKSASIGTHTKCM